MEPSLPITRFMVALPVLLVMLLVGASAPAAPAPPPAPAAAAGGLASAHVSGTTPQCTMLPFCNPSSPSVLLPSSPLGTNGDLQAASLHRGEVYSTLGRTRAMDFRRSATVEEAVRLGTRQRPALVRTRMSMIFERMARGKKGTRRRQGKMIQECEPTRQGRVGERHGERQEVRIRSQHKMCLECRR